MPSIYEQAQQFRADLIRRDTAAINYLTAEYKLVYARILRALAGISNQITEAQRNGQQVSRAWLNEQWRYQSFLRQLDSEFQSYASTLSSTVTARQAFETSQGRADASAMIGGRFDRLPVAAIENIIANLRAESPLAKLLDSFGDVASQQVAQTLRDAVVLGQNPRKIAPRVRDALGVPLARALTICRTESNRAYRQATADTYHASDIVTGYIWVASKSRRTCLACLALDGVFFPKDKPQPSHINCRCTSYAAIEGQQPSRRETAGQWFERQSDAVKREIAGTDAGFEALKSGKVTLRDFVGLSRSRKWGQSYYQLGVKRALAGEGEFPG